MSTAQLFLPPSGRRLSAYKSMPPRDSTRLVATFESDVRQLDERGDVEAKTRRISRDLEKHVAQFATEMREGGSTPEQMLVELKNILAHAAPDVPSSQRSELVAAVTGRAIQMFFAEEAHPRRTLARRRQADK